MDKEVILIPGKIKSNQLNKLKAVAKNSEFICCNQHGEIKDSDLERATIIFGNISVSQLKKAIHLKWMQTSSAGVDAYCQPGILVEGAILTNATGAYGGVISEYMVGCVLAFYKNLLRYKVRQPQAIWSNIGHIKYVENTKVLVLGMGDIGTQFAIKMKKMGAYIIGIKRTMGDKPTEVDELYTTSQLKEVIGKADIIALSLPRTEKTYHLLDDKMFALMKEDALIINVGRGEAIDTHALLRCIENNKLLGAALDVFEEEPLPKDHPLWQKENVLITPHVSGGNYDLETGDLIFNLMYNNFMRYFNHEELKHQVDLKTGYKKSNT